IEIILIFILKILYLFFFSSRRRHTRSKRDWSSDVCSSDLLDSTKLKNEIKLLKQDGFKVALYTNENDTKCLVATKGGQIRYNLEKDFIKLYIKGIESAKDFASNVDVSKEDALENLKKTISSKPDPNTDTEIG